MAKQGFVSVTMRERAVEIAYDLSKITDLSVPTIIEKALKFYKKEKLAELKKRKSALE